MSHLISLLALRGEIIYTLNQLKAHPRALGYVPTFETLRDEWTGVFAEELARRDALSAANARVASADVTLNHLASRVSKAVLTPTGDDRTHPLYVAYFKKKTLSEFRRPMLGAQLDAMRGWIQPLTMSNAPALAELGPEVQAAVAAADEVLALRAGIEAEGTFFREAGNRKRLFDRVNGVRKVTYGELARLPHENTGVPVGFADLREGVLMTTTQNPGWAGGRRLRRRAASSATMTATRSLRWTRGLRAAGRAGLWAGVLALGPGCAPDLHAGCTGGQTECEGACVDMDSDPGHCGSCGHDCLGGACLQGTCQPLVLSSGPPRAFDVAVDATSAYWTSEGAEEPGNDGEVSRVSLLDGGASTPIASDEPAPRGMALDGDNIYWVNSEGDTLRMAPKAGGDPVILASGLSAPRDVAVDATHVYYTDQGSGEVMKAPIDMSGDPIPLFVGVAGPDGIALDATHAYWVNRNEGIVRRVPITGSTGDATVLFDGEGGPTDIAVDATHAYWTHYESGEVVKISIQDDESEATVIAEGEHGPFGIAVDATHVYWVNYDSGEVRRAPIEGGAAVSLAAGQVGPRRITLDGSAIYWTNHDSGELMKLAR